MPTNPVEIILMFSTGFVAFVLLLSGGAKLRRPAQTLEAMRALQAPAFAQRRWIAALLPFWEIAVALGLLLAPSPFRGVAGAAALGTFLLFTVFVVRILIRGEQVDCGCFGSLSVDDRVTWWTVVRNLVLIVASAVVLLASAGHPPFIFELFTADLVQVLVVSLAWALTAIVVLVLLLIRRGHPKTPTRNDAVAGVGAPLPDAELVSAESVTVPLLALGSGSPVLLVFLSASCSSCVAVSSRLAEWQRAIDPVQLRVATSSRPAVLGERMPEALPFAYYGAQAARRALGVQGSAAAVLLGGSAHPFVSSPIARGEDEIDALVRGVVAARSAVPPAQT
ncbi:MauE/DoxX family redox-associated membrane protein [Microbacterium sp. NPDC057659]|uniref:MauE/DoxX family redox-associated membrane protein n=1 Tax=Microbacterium sp. NPDC057659 TaxID=3346198 RepID=UPI0036721526